MSVQLIQRYHTELAQIKRIGRTINEEPLSKATEDLLTHYARTHNLFFVRQPQRKTPTGHSIRPDGMIGDQFFDWGYWEAKDPKNDLDKEIAEKLAKGYPTSNILFENTITAVLYQAGVEVGRVQTKNLAEYDDLLNRFVTYQPPEIQIFREEIEQFKTVVPELAEQLRDIIEEQADSNAPFKQSADDFLELCRKAINPAVVMADVREMLIQHILTQDIFNVIFDDPDFHRENGIAKKLGEVVETFYDKRGEKRAIQAKIRPFYEIIKARSAQIESHHEKQRFLKVLYETFYKAYNPKAADRLGIVYTPNEIVRFMVESADTLCYRHFQKSLSDDGVHILDPATGTGTYIVELLQFWEGLASRDPDQFKRKYENDVHCNEVSILPYYIANLNIEYTYQALTGDYEPFENIVFVDTLDWMNQNVAQKKIDLFAEENAARIEAQNKREISVIIGNPPYNANQLNENENNKNRPYPEIDKRIKATYIKHSTAQKTKLYDMYTRFIRWASDRLSREYGGIIAFITNRSFLDARGFDGFRKVVANEFSHIYIVDLGGDVRKNPKLSGSKHNVFAIQTGVAIMFLVRSPDKKQGFQTPCRIHYVRRPELEEAHQKLHFLATNEFNKLDFDSIRPNKHYDWLNLVENDWSDFLPLGSKDVKFGIDKQHKAIFQLFSLGSTTNRDDWLYDHDQDQLRKKIATFVEVYEHERERWIESDKEIPINDFVDRTIKWTSELEAHLVRNTKLEYRPELIRLSARRPYVKQWFYYDRIFVHRLYQQPEMFRFGEADKNKVLCVNVGSKPFNILVAGDPIDLHFNGDSQCFPLHRYDQRGNQVDNITDWGVDQFRTHYTDADITKEAIFHYVYAVLHHPAYRTKYELNLKREFPRIPFYADFWQWAEWGKALMAFHLNYETIEPYPLQRHDKDPDTVQKVYKAKLKRVKDDDKSDQIELDTLTTLGGVPEVAYAYRLGNRSAIEWVLDRYKERKPRDPTIREQFNTYKFIDYKEDVIMLLGRVTAVSVETMGIIAQMPETVEAAQGT